MLLKWSFVVGYGTSVSMENGSGYRGVNPEVEENGEEHFEEVYRRDAGFRATWDAKRIQRELGYRVLERRLTLGLSQRELARRIGTSEDRVYLVENGEENPTPQILERLAEVLGAELESER